MNVFGASGTQQVNQPPVLPSLSQHTAQHPAPPQTCVCLGCQVYIQAWTRSHSLPLSPPNSHQRRMHDFKLRVASSTGITEVPLSTKGRMYWECHTLTGSVYLFPPEVPPHPTETGPCGHQILLELWVLKPAGPRTSDVYIQFCVGADDTIATSGWNVGKRNKHILGHKI